MPIFLLLVAVPIIEIALFIQVGGLIGLWPTIGVVILTAAIGTLLLRSQGLATLNELQRRLAAGEDPSATLAHGALILVAGLVLLTPGFFTDAVGFGLLVPPVRAAVIAFLRKRISVAHMAGASGMRAGMGGGVGSGRHGPVDPSPTTVDGDYEILDPEEPPARRGDSGWTRGLDENKPD